MDNTIIFTIIGSAVGIVILNLGIMVPFLIHILNRLDKCATKEELSEFKSDVSTKIDLMNTKIDLMNTNLSTKIDLMNANIICLIMDIRDRLSQLEAHMQPKVFPIHEEKPKKKAKGD